MQEIITGYTGTRHIKPAMDAAVWRSIFGPDHYIVNVGSLCAGSMPSINEFTILDGVVSMQGHMGYGTEQTLAVDTCSTGFKRIDLVVVRFTHDSSTLIDNMEYMVLKGSEVPDSEVPGPPTHSTGIIDDGATQVDFPLYEIELNGSTVSFRQLAEIKKVGSGDYKPITMTAKDGSSKTLNVVVEE